jgi:HAD superfamily phosphatase
LNGNDLSVLWGEFLVIVVFDIDGVVRDVGGSYRRALADTVEEFTGGKYRPSEVTIDELKGEGIWNNDWEASRELTYRYFASQGRRRDEVSLDYEAMVAFFQTRYRGTDPQNWNGYICQEPLLMTGAYLESLTAAGISWGFFSGATRASATYVLSRRLGLQAPVLVAMEDAPGKPDPTGLLATVAMLEGAGANRPVIYIGDTVADMYTVERARQLQSDRKWVAIGVLPPHVWKTERQAEYAHILQAAGAGLVFDHVQQLTAAVIGRLLG